MRSPDGALEAICTVSTDITERLRTEETAHHLAVYDALTRSDAADGLRRVR